MPAFVTNGPDIPEHLLQAHEEGRVVFFCGAGISYPAKLPNFAGLVTSLYKDLGVLPDPTQLSAIKSGQFDTAISLLELDIVGGREKVRKSIALILTPDLTRPNATCTHEALLTLGSCRGGQLRLVTTNFDRVFEEVIEANAIDVESFNAPLLPIPKNRWDGLVYLHGLLPKSGALTPSKLDRIVVSSGDFGLAYLIERWAARFVSELFRNYTVCFVGYSINDPVLRYMTDALAADRLLGESPPQMYAFGSYTKGMEAKRAAEWRAKNVLPILYREDKSHSLLHRTLKGWADTYRDGVRGKEMIIAQHATSPPLAPSRTDFAVGRMLWALTDDSAARHFADLTPVPPLEWLGPLAEAQFGHDDLPRFGVTPKAEMDKGLSFCMISRPAPYTLAPYMNIADVARSGSQWDEAMRHIARWLTRHLNDPKLLLWLAKNGGQLHDRFLLLVRSRITELRRLEDEGNQDVLKAISEAAPNAIPSSLMRTLWRLFLCGRIKSTARGRDLYDWVQRFKHDGLTATLRIELREILSPRVALRERFWWPDESLDSRPAEHIRDIVNVDLELSADHVHSVLSDLESSSTWKSALPEILPDFNVLLRDALELLHELGNADEYSDFSHFALPSISKHPQNNDLHDWTALIELTRDAWLDTAKINPTRARLYVESWWDTPYPLFKRLTFFAATNTELISSDEATTWLLADKHWWLWSVETQREVIRLLIALAPKVGQGQLKRLEKAILQGPPREMFRDDIIPSDWKSIVDHEIWLRLAKLREAGAALSQNSIAKLVELRILNPLWKINPDERDEFPHWIGSGEEWRKYVTSPRRRRDLMKWLITPITEFYQDDDWLQRCREDFRTTTSALCGLAQTGHWPSARWRAALQAWTESELLQRSWRYMARLIVQMPHDVLVELSHPISWWLQNQAKVFQGQEGLFFTLVQSLFKAEYEDKETNDPVSRAINHPVGGATEALLRWWYRQEPNDGENLPQEIRPLFSWLCDTQFDKFRHGRVVLSAHTVSLFRVDEEWCQAHLIPLFYWQSSPEALAVWQGFLRSPRLYWPLLKVLKSSFLETGAHYGELGEYAKQYADLLTFAALDPGGVFTIKELATATQKLPAEGLKSAAQTITRALEGAGQQRGEYWHNRVLPYLKWVWPKTHQTMTPAISERLARVCIASGENFPDAMIALRYWLQPLEQTNYLIHSLNEKNICKHFPLEALSFLDAIVGENQWLTEELAQSLKEIGDADQTLRSHIKFIRLFECCTRQGINY